MNPYQKEISERFYFSYQQGESDYLKQQGFFYITKGIHPRNKLIFCMYDRSEELIKATQDFRKARVGN
ncbi:hypothetical protein [Neobacillus sp. PS3-40]|uniref:hypothetical protein n=1 Tax=Neobacillus sp. PS3-40 TaxID=3070679 RepID=UPI0027E1E44E|nr:hypothetical protein [Neobacillus sp. PS3-40]WML44064.1 hypothetical protein RCG20_20150 [Neobacillus sp. PS3-40]